MSKHIDNFRNLLTSREYNNTITIVDSSNDGDDYNLTLDLYSKTNDKYQLKINSDFMNYCYIDAPYSFIDKLNQGILFTNAYTSLLLTMEIIDTYNFETNVNKRVKFSDDYNFYSHTKVEEKTKVVINYDELKLQSKIKDPQTKGLNINIPKELLLNNFQIYELILTEIKKINSTYDYPHSIIPINNNIFRLQVNLKVKDVNLELIIELDSKLYPFFPPKIEISKPKVKLPLYFAVMNLDITKIINWNSAMSLEWIIINLAKKLEPIIYDYLNDYLNDNNDFNNLEYLILKLANLNKEFYSDKLNINFDIPKYNTINQSNKKATYWKSGTGYGSGSGVSDWNITTFVKEKELEKIEFTNLLISINNIITPDNIFSIKSSYLLKYILKMTSGINLLEIESNYTIFKEIMKCIEKILNSHKSIEILEPEYINELIINLKPIYEEIVLLFNIDEDMQSNELYQSIHNIYSTNVLDSNKQVEDISDKSIIQKYCDNMKPLQFDMTDLDSSHSYKEYIYNKLEPQALKRVISEITSFKNGLPLNYESTIWLRVPKTNMNLFTFIISGPKDTPYENGLFKFDAYLPYNYPGVEPKVLLKTTGNGTVRFNPNLYNCGKVCLSLLGTWSGDQNEKWNSKTSTFLQVLVSIQSLIFVEEPYFNEPGYEKTMNTTEGRAACKAYNENIQIATIKWAMIDQIKNPNSQYKNVILEHFKLKKEDIIKTINKWLTNCNNSKYKPTLEVEVKNLTVLLDTFIC